MTLSTNHWRWLFIVTFIVGFAGTAHAQRTVTLTLNTATVPDTIRTDSQIKVMGAVDGEEFTLPDGNVISWDTAGEDESTLEATNVGGDYWEISFEIPDNAETVFKFWSAQSQETTGDGWEADPNPTIESGTGDVEMPLHYFESTREWHGVSGDRGEYEWRPFESKEDSVGVWFRVFASTEYAVGNAGYDREDPDMVLGLRGDPLGGEGPLDWGVTQVQLMPESSSLSVPGYHIFSGVAYYPESLAGSQQPYKFFIEPEGWEGSDDRTFTVPTQDSTLQWVYFSNSPAATAQPVESGVIFAVDLTPLEQIGVFDTARGDTLQVRGEFNNWACDDPDRCLLLPVPGEPVFEQLIPITAFPGSPFRYKFLIEINDQRFMDEFGVEVVPSGWEEPISTTGADRSFLFEGDPNDFQVIEARFNDIFEENIVPEGTSIDINFTVDMTPALDAADPFDPEAHVVTIWIEDPIWLFTQRLPIAGPDDQFRAIPDAIILEDPDGDMVYEGTLTVNGPTYAALQYKFSYGTGDNYIAYLTEPGGTTADLGRRRTRFVEPNADGSWPTVWDFPSETYQVEGTLPFETNPVTTGVEEVGGELPSQIALGQNYPNPFNPATTFEYTLDQTQHVQVKVFDVTGRLVQTLVDGVQSASTYRVTFDGANLASGVYMYRLETPNQVITKKMALIK